MTGISVESKSSRCGPLYFLVSFTITPLRNRTAMIFGTAIKPFRISARFQTRFGSTIEPTRTAPGPPSAIAVPTPMIFAVPIVEDKAVVRAPNWETSPAATVVF